MHRAGWIGLIAVAAIGGALAGRASSDAATTHFGVPTGADPNARLSVDLFHPSKNPTRTIVVVLQGNDPGEPDERAPIAAAVGETFQRRDIDVASITFRVGREAPLDACASAVATAIAEVAKGHDRVVLLGRGVGARVAAMLALDARFFESTRFERSRVKGVIGLRGTYDLGDVAPMAAAAPPFLLLSAERDDERFARSDRDFAHVLARHGVEVERHILPYRDAHSLTHLTGEDNDLGELVFGFVAKGLVPLSPDSGVIELQKRWDEAPPLDLAELRADPKRRTTYPVDAALRATLDLLFHKFPYPLYQLAGKTYEAIDLASWLASRPESEVGKGDHLVVTNLRDEKLYYTRADIERLKPRLVVGLDDEANLYRLFVYYRLHQDYSWKTPLSTGQHPMPLMIRPLGAFLHFPDAPATGLANKSYAQFSLTAKSFHWQETDPLATVRALPTTVLPTLIGEQGCLKCHAFRGAGSKAHHLLASDAAPYGAYALSLEEYPDEVLRRFLFEQESVARGFNVAPLMVERPVADELYALVVKARR